jgi:hypothetical protein
VANFGANAGGTPADGNDYILYNTSTGALSYDADGTGAGLAQVFAALQTSLLMANDIHIGLI